MSEKIFLMIDDDLDFLELEKIYLKQYAEYKNLEVSLNDFTDSIMAEEVLFHKDNSPDLILLDAFMPGKNGWEVIDDLKEKRPELLAKTILITGIVEEVEAARNNNITVLIKPISKELLFQTIDSILFK